MNTNEVLTKVKKTLKNRELVVIKLDNAANQLSSLARTLLSALERQLKHDGLEYDEKQRLRKETNELSEALDKLYRKEVHSEELEEVMTTVEVGD